MENESVIKKQDQIFLLVDIADNLYGRDVALEFMDQNWDYLSKL